MLGSNFSCLKACSIHVFLLFAFSDDNSAIFLRTSLFTDPAYLEDHQNSSAISQLERCQSSSFGYFKYSGLASEKKHAPYFFFFTSFFLNFKLIWLNVKSFLLESCLCWLTLAAFTWSIRCYFAMNVSKAVIFEITFLQFSQSEYHACLSGTHLSYLC